MEDMGKNMLMCDLISLLKTYRFPRVKRTALWNSTPGTEVTGKVYVQSDEHERNPKASQSQQSSTTVTSLKHTSAGLLDGQVFKGSSFFAA